ncbi:HAD-superfamily class IIA hydrolase, TIGR01459 [Arboricoccus pini]|uniref:HAD-superfamily class IIA hydrolase, TIGR01459 n=1 Tax=Arboricoccus pini TaxID=1963835 RepID=A0A212RDG3_9PROT|nr:TIGR01459 family HAD-type hydrolase [Arboricoccus pini]SNB70164.1 HAD-superfamily class IIA hydrolase, TIGR01459 [Arboricoccus pini]
MAGIEPLIDLYDAFLLDQFGVLHDGEQALPGAIDALSLLAAAGRTVILLSNSGKRSAPNRERLARFGIGPDLYADMVTSGDVAFEALRRRHDPLVAGLGDRCLYIGRGQDVSAVAGLKLELVGEPSAADFVLLGGLDANDESPARARTILDAARRQGLPILCTNPDLVSLDGAKRFPGPGQLAVEAMQAGADIRWIGKPWPRIYTTALALLPPGRRVIGIGDSPTHDIAGANNAGLPSCLVLSGVHKANVTAPRLIEASQLPTYQLPSFAPTASGDALRH